MRLSAESDISYNIRKLDEMLEKLNLAEDKSKMLRFITIKEFAEMRRLFNQNCTRHIPFQRVPVRVIWQRICSRVRSIEAMVHEKKNKMRLVASQKIKEEIKMKKGTKTKKENPICCLCGRECEDEWGNDPYPLSYNKEDRCCTYCNYAGVVPARFYNANVSDKLKNRELKIPDSLLFSYRVHIGEITEYEIMEDETKKVKNNGRKQ